MKHWTINSDEKGLDGLTFVDAPMPQVGDNDILVKLQGASLNYRDLAIPTGKFPFSYKFPVVAGSDGAGEVVQVGPRVTQWKKGDRVVTLFNQAHQYGPVSPSIAATGLGGIVDGTFAQFGVYNESGVVRAPKNLNFVEASTLTAAALTSWNALYGLRSLKPGETVLVQGTGFAKAAGAKVIATTSSARKVEILKQIGADVVINYKEDPNWGQTARKFTPGEAGVDHIIDVGGMGTLKQSLAAVKFEGIINVIGFLAGSADQDIPSAAHALKSVCTIRGLYVGSRAQMEEMVAAIEANDIHPIVDPKIFTLEQAREAYEYLATQQHVGKVCIKIE
ncbi:Zinc-type alcohol dehydrogenase-like protein [Cladobotryum mycophilum]|uniref:Zinc-type alcohol dehydrogenase-like protein n=1 Tax=Cladobotryum mycophilum TaxID=491253 RepID=A0ABR0SFT1_9HYPO